VKRREILRSLCGIPLGLSSLSGNEIHSDIRKQNKRHNPQESLVGQLTELLEPGTVTLLAGRPCNGKTSLATTLAMEFMQQGKHAKYFTMQKTIGQFSRETGLSRLVFYDLPITQNLRTVVTRSETSGAVLQITEAPFPDEKIFEQIPISMGAKPFSQPELIVFDEFASSPDSTSTWSTLIATPEYAQKLQCHAQNLRAALLVVVRLKSVGLIERQDKRPSMYDLSHLEQWVTNQQGIFFVHRPRLYDHMLPNDVLELSVGRFPERSNFNVSLSMDTGSRRLKEFSYGQLLDY